MARNFCGVVDFDNEIDSRIAMKMADKLNVNRRYFKQQVNLSKASLVNLYSANFPAPKENIFVEMLKNRYAIVSFSLLIRLDELLKKLAYEADIQVLSDEEIILRSFLKWGKDLVHHLEGDWAFAIYDSQEQELFVARNPHAEGTIFYYQTDNRIYFSSMITGLVNIEGIPLVLDQEKFFMESMTISGFPSKTLYRNLYFLEPGHFMSVKRNQSQLSQYWRPYELPQTRFHRDEDYFTSLYETYSQAVRDRLTLGDRWGFAISGGLDSAATAGIASKYFAERSQKLKALCYTPMVGDFKKYNSNKKFGDESEFAEIMASYDQNIDLELVSKDGAIWEYMASYAKDFGVPPHIANTWFADALSQKAVERNMSMVMTAQGGNQSISYFGVPSFKNLPQLSCDLSNGLEFTSYELVKAIGKSVWGSIKLSLKGFSTKKRTRFDQMIEHWTFLRKDFVKSIHGYELLEEHYYGRENDSLTPAEARMRRTLGVGRHCRMGLWNQIGTQYDLVYIDPTRDQRLLELLISFPNHIFNRNGEAKFLYKQSFKHQVPKEVMLNKRKGFSMSDIVYRYQQNFDYFKTLLETKRKVPVLNEMVDFERIEAYYSNLIQTKDISEPLVLDVVRKNGSLYQALLTDF